MDSTVLKAIDVLEALARAEGSRGVTEIAKEVGLTKSNVHRLLKTLESRGLVAQSAEDNRYALALRLWELGLTVIDRLDVKRVAGPYLRELGERTRETVHLSMLNDGDVVYVDKIDSPEPVRAYSRIGGRAPAYCVATGKALLAYAPDELVHAVARTLFPHTERTVRTEAQLRHELELVRARGYAINHGEWRESVWGLAAPIRQAPGRVVAAVGISGPALRLKPRRIKECTPIVVATANAISARLGYRAPAQATAGVATPARAARALSA